MDEVKEMLKRMTTDINDYWSKSKLSYEGKSTENKFFDEHVATSHSLQALRDKIGRIFSWKVCQSEFNPEDKSIMFEIIVDQTKAQKIKMSYEDICKLFWMKSFEVGNGDSFKPVYMSYEEREAIERPLVEASRKRLEAEAKKKAKSEEAA